MNIAPSKPDRFFASNLTFRQLVTWCLVIGGLPMLLLVVGCGAGESANEAPSDMTNRQAALPVETIVLEKVASFEKHRTFTGVIRASRTSELGFERTGRLVSVEVSEGDRVEAGQGLAKLDATNLKAKKQELTAQRAAAQSLLDELQAGPRKETIESARAEQRDLQSQVELAQLSLKRQEQLLASRATSREEYDNASLKLRSARAKLDAADQRLRELESGTRVERIDAQKFVVAQLDAAIANVVIDIGESILRAPFAGIIGERYLDEGTIVQSGSPLLRLVEEDRLEAWIGLPPGLAKNLNVGEPVKLTVGQEEISAMLMAVLPELDAATRTQTAIFQLEPNCDAIPSQLARVMILDRVEAQGYWAPLTALTRGSRGLWSVLVVQQDDEEERFITTRRDVEVLHTDGQRVLIRGTIQSGEEVVVTGTHRVVAGQVVQVIETTTNDFL